MSPRPWEVHCTAARVVQLHAQGLTRYGGREGVNEPNGPDATLGAAWNAVTYSPIQDGEPVLLFAAYVVFYFATKQVFADGNKRIAWLAMSEVLASVDLEVDATTDEAEEMVLLLATKRVRSVEWVYGWLTERVRELERLAVPIPSAAASPKSPR